MGTFSCFVLFAVTHFYKIAIAIGKCGGRIYSKAQSCLVTWFNSELPSRDRKRPGGHREEGKVLVKS